MFAEPVIVDAHIPVVPPRLALATSHAVFSQSYSGEILAHCW
jgi:hypothetical protein